MAFSIVLDRFLNDSALELAASLDLEFKSTNLQTTFQSYLDQEDQKQELLNDILKLTNDYSKLSDKAFEPICNLTLHLLDILSTELEIEIDSSLSTYLINLCQIQSSSLIKSNSIISILSNIFNFLPSSSHLRIEVLQNILSIISRDNLKKLISPLSKNLNTWLNNSNATEDEFKSIYIQTIELLYLENQLESIELFKSFISSKSESLQLNDYKNFFIKSLNCNNNYIDLNSLNLNSLQQDQILFELLNIYKSLDLESYLLFIENNKNQLINYNINIDNLTYKLKIASITKLASNKTQLSYNEISSNLHISLDELELFLINCIKLKLISGRLNQDKQILYLHKVVKLNTIDIQDWKLINEDLSNWSNKMTDLKQFIELLQNKKGKKISPPQVIQIYHQQKQELKGIKEQLQQEKDKVLETSTEV
ncbi:hypothetical protein CANARDRAFT_24431 [[Candida] arabinofermentans NRRL YB-2248]|uniref:PCI domain-containing protein n=1 Tax=[Candida] arabinofermentans NRRL YB-2248 TaxID=983967 RepID=A0A1E4SWZ6_9ASCO|nr:hypothetical protein CANARDRAFT_24431 [[Candida] arabinofermentans NRRL YB-2248]